MTTPQTIRREKGGSSRRPLHRGDAFTSEPTRLGRVYRQRGMTVEQVLEAVARHKAVLHGGPGGTVAKRHEKTNVTLIDWEGTLGAGRLCVKEFIRPAMTRFLPAALRHRNALRAWKASHELRARGVRGPEALAVLLGKGLSSYLIMQVVEAAGRLYDYASSGISGAMPVARRRAFLRAGATALEKVYAAGVAHGDMKSTNVLVIETASGEWEFALLDLDAVRFPGKVNMQQKILNLAQLNAGVPLNLTWTDRLRFLRYLGESEPRLFTRATMRAIGRLTRERTCLWS